MLCSMLSHMIHSTVMTLLTGGVNELSDMARCICALLATPIAPLPARETPLADSTHVGSEQCVNVTREQTH